MEVTAILHRARELGLTIEADDDVIVVRPKGAIPPDLAATIRANKAALISALTSEKPPAPADQEAHVEHILQLGADRHEADRPTITKPHPSDYRETVVETHLRLDRLAVPQSASDLRAKELIRVCREYGVGLKLDPDGTLVVVSNGNAWRSLVNEIELHIDAVAELIVAGWDPTDA